MAFLLGCLLSVLIAGTGLDSRQIGYLWSMEELAARADTIVIAEHTGTADARHAVVHPELKPALPAVQMESVFTVLAVLKTGRNGAVSGGALRLKHYRVDLEESRRREGRSRGLLDAGTSLDFGQDKGPYLLFLTALEGDLYRPVSGFAFPTASVRVVRSMDR